MQIPEGFLCLMKTAAIIVAGGSGKRVGSELPKQFLPLAEKPMIFYSLETFERSSFIDSITLVLPEDKITYFSSTLLVKHPLSKLKKIVPGGATRQDSTWAGFKSVDEKVELVAVHDAARPFVDLQTIERCILAAQEMGASLAACKASDTLKESDREGFVLRTIDRTKIYHAQTPQVFRYAVLKEALEWADANHFQGTDETSLVEKIGKPVKIVETDSTNIKLTTATDFLVAEALLRQKLCDE
jgi:2-C-methyl-D-erythritol 4-phosphate cytidylyltransferase